MHFLLREVRSVHHAASELVCYAADNYAAAAHSDSAASCLGTQDNT